MRKVILISSLITTVAVIIAFSNEIEVDTTLWEALAQVSIFIFCTAIIGKILDLWTTGKK